MDGPVVFRRLLVAMRSCFVQAAPACDFNGGMGGTRANLVVLVVVLACTIAYRMSEPCVLDGYRDGVIISQPHFFMCYHTHIPLIGKHLTSLQVRGDAQNDVHK